MEDNLEKESNLLIFDQENVKIPFCIKVMTYFAYALLMIFGHFRDILIRFRIVACSTFIYKDISSPGFVPLLRDFENFYYRNLYRRVQDLWNRPIASHGGTVIKLLERKSMDQNFTFELTGNQIDCINFGSYNYLGFGNPTDTSTDVAKNLINQYGISTCSSVSDYGKTVLLNQLERSIASFLGTESSICFGMGFSTNSTNIPVLVGPGCCIFSDELNHASIILGARNSGAKIYVYKHNDMTHLESLIRDAIIQGQPKTHRNWKKIIVVCEGIYSMEGDFVNLPKLLYLKEKYKIYIYLDEAHSIGAIGNSGRGVCEYFGIDPKNIDIMMGTFTKSFGASGGYIAGKTKLIEYIRNNSFGSLYTVSMSPVIIGQIKMVIDYLFDRVTCRTLLDQLKSNTRLVRNKLKELGFLVIGHNDSPVVPLYICHPGLLSEFSRFMLRKNIAVVVVGFPATTILSSRTRICLSALHTVEQINYFIDAIDEFGRLYKTKYYPKKLKLFKS